MAAEGYKRKLTAIMSADVAGYSRLMGEDEDATIRTLTAYRDLISTLIQKHRGRVVDSPGDNLLAEFLSVVDAVRCAVEIQEELRVRNAELPDSRKMQFRIGINLGDVVEEEGRIYGDGINIAARVEGLAESGGICISGTVYESIKNKLSLGYESMGEHTVKNIPEPVRVYRMRIGPEAGSPKFVKEKKLARKGLSKAVIAIIGIVVIAVAAILYQFVLRPSFSKIGAPAIPPRMSIVVLPFTNASGDPSKEYVADAITEEIAVELSKIKGSFVIGRNTAFTYKGRSVDLKAISRDLGIRYILQGTAAQTGRGLHVTAQLIDGATGANLWADTVDADLGRTDEIRRQVVSRLAIALNLQLIFAEAAHAKKDLNPAAADLTMQGWAKYNKGLSKKNIQEAIPLFTNAIEIEPDFEPALAGRAMTLAQLAQSYPGPDRAKLILEAEKDAQKAVSLDPTDANAYFALAWVRQTQSRTKEALQAADQALEINPNHIPALTVRGLYLILNGRSASAFEPLQKALDLSPLDPYRGRTMFYMCHACIHLGKFGDAVKWCEKSAAIWPNFWPYSDLVAAYAALGEVEQAETAKANLFKLKPDFTIGFCKSLKFSENPVWKEEIEKNIWANLRKAGVPE
jgi:adenylate cyclase